MQKAAPRFTARRRFRSALRRPIEFEQVLLPVLCSPKRVSVDVGAADGAYAFPLTAHSLSVVAIEPRQAAANRLEAAARILRLPLEVLTVAVSSSPGTSAFRCVEGDEGRSTLEVANPLNDVKRSSVIEFEVESATLDGLSIENVGFIKIDVEGHELAVLSGGLGTIQRNLPNIMVEIEERHAPGSLHNCGALLGQFGYRGFFVNNGILRPISEFDAGVLQDPRNIGDISNGYRRLGQYVNNFVFLPPTEIENFLQKAQALLSTVHIR